MRRWGVVLAAWLCFLVLVIAAIQASAAWSMDRGPFANAVTRGIGAKVTLHTRRAFAAELQAEGGEAENNPFNTTISAPGATCYNIVPCVKNYPTPKIGIEATIRTLKQECCRYNLIRRPVILNAPATRIVRGFGESEWGTNLELVIAVLSDIKADRKPNTLIELEARPIAN